MSHAAAAFILQKSNEVLSMIKAFKRKANSNTSAATTTQNDASNSSLPQSKHTSAVNCMSLRLNDNRVFLFDNSDASNSNIYTEIDLRDVLPITKNLVTEPNPISSSDSSISSDIMHFLFDESNELQFKIDHNQSETNQIDKYVNESVTSQAIVQMEMNVINDRAMTEQNLYDIDSVVPNVTTEFTAHRNSEQNAQLAESATNSNSSLKSNTFFANISKSLKHKLKHVLNEEVVPKESLSDGMINSASGNEIAFGESDKASQKKRFKFKLKTGLHLFKVTKVGCYKHLKDLNHRTCILSTNGLTVFCWRKAHKHSSNHIDCLHDMYIQFFSVQQHVILRFYFLDDPALLIFRNNIFYHIIYIAKGR